MKTTLNADGLIDIPQQIRGADHLAPGDSFELQRLTPGHYLLTKQPQAGTRFVIAIGDDASSHPSDQRRHYRAARE